MGIWTDRRLTMGLSEIDAVEKQLADKHGRARRLGAMSWREFWIDLGMRSLLILGGVGLLALVLWLLGR